MKNSKKVITGFLMLLTSTYSIAQQDPQFTQYFDNTLFVNPAYAGSKDMLNITTIHREQWVGFSGRPRSTTLSIHSPLTYRSIGLGFTAVHDQAGPVRQTMFYGDFSYSLKFKNSKAKLSFGLKAGLNLLNVGTDNLITSQANDANLINNIQNRVNPNFGFGILYHGPKFFAGISTPKLMEQSYDGQKTNLEKRHYFATLGYVFTLSNQWKLRPTSQFKYTQGAPFSLDVSVAAIYNEKIWIGAMYRLDAAFGAFLQYQISPQFKVGLASDFGTQRIRNYNSGTFEIMLSYDFTFQKTGVLSPRYF